MNIPWIFVTDFSLWTGRLTLLSVWIETFIHSRDPNAIICYWHISFSLFLTDKQRNSWWPQGSACGCKNGKENPITRCFSFPVSRQLLLRKFQRNFTSALLAIWVIRFHPTTLSGFASVYSPEHLKNELYKAVLLFTWEKSILQSPCNRNIIFFTNVTFTFFHGSMKPWQCFITGSKIFTHIQGVYWKLHLWQHS